MKSRYLGLALGVVLMLSGCDNSQPVNSAEVRWQWTEKPSVTTDTTALVSEEPTSVPKSMVIVFDGSGSMCGDSMVQAKRATKMYLESLSEEVAVGLVAFDGGHGAVVDISLTRGNIAAALDGLDCGGGTPLAGAVAQAYQMLLTHSQTLGGRGEYHLVVVTDGDADDNSLLTNNVDQIVGHSPVNIFTIGFKIDDGHVLNRPGPQIRYVSADNEAEISRGLKKVLAEALDPAAMVSRSNTAQKTDNWE
jgi:uncharacterized protein with von Willebrand factor type A (vWA) domain